jgi:hypothetical protein
MRSGGLWYQYFRLSKPGLTPYGAVRSPGAISENESDAKFSEESKLAGSKKGEGHFGG